MTSPVPDLTRDPSALRLVKQPFEVPVRFATSYGQCDTLEGAVRYRAGDAILTGRHQEHWPVQRNRFDAAYEPVAPTVAGSDGHYRKRPDTVMALCLTAPLEGPVGWQEDPLHGRPGDWLLRYQDGSHSIVQNNILLETYGPAAGETRWPPGADALNQKSDSFP